MTTFETMGNAIVLLSEGNRPLLVTDPWLVGTAYYGSWAQDRPLTEDQRKNCLAAPFAWFSHGHPDHLHVESVDLMSRQTTILLGDHYNTEIRDFFHEKGFKDIRVCQDKQWMELSPRVRVMSIANINQDTILVIENGDNLVINQNDSPFFGEDPFFRRMVRRYKKTYLLALCSIDADMFNFIDEAGNSLAGPPDLRKKGTILQLAKRCDYLGVQNFCCSSSQHVYVRADSAWANPYRIGWDDMQRHWISRSTKLIEPYVTIDLDTGQITRNHQSQESDLSRVSDMTGDDDWTERLTAAEWSALEKFVRKFETLQSKTDFIEFVVGGERRRFFLTPRAETKSQAAQRGVIFHVPRRSLMSTVEYGYFDDLLIGNFMKTQLVNMRLYPDFSPRLAKYGGNAKVYTQAQLARFYWHYFRRSPGAMVRFAMESAWQHSVLPAIKNALAAIGLFHLAKQVYQRRHRVS